MSDHLLEIATLFFVLGAVLGIAGFIMLAISMSDNDNATAQRRRGLLFIVIGALCLLAGGTFCSAGFAAH